MDYKYILTLWVLLAILQYSKRRAMSHIIIVTYKINIELRFKTWIGEVPITCLKPWNLFFEFKNKNLIPYKNNKYYNLKLVLNFLELKKNIFFNAQDYIYRKKWHEYFVIWTRTSRFRNK